MFTLLSPYKVSHCHSVKLLAAAVVFLGVALSTESACGKGLPSVLDDLIRGTAKVADDVPVKKVDDLVSELSKSQAARKAVDAELDKAGRILKTKQVLRGAARADEVLRLLRETTQELDPSLIRRLEDLDGASREAAFVLAKGSQDIARTVPDLSVRGRLLREGGAETVAAVGMFGPEALRAAMRLDQAIQGGKVVVKGGQKAVTLADFGGVMTRFGEAAWNFWKRYVEPHWPLWVGSGALAAYLANPEFFQDAVGNLTKAGFKLLTEFVGEVAASAIRGLGEGTASATDRVRDAIVDTYFTGERKLSLIFVTMAALGCLSLLFRRVRYWVFLPFRWLNQVPPSQQSPKS